MEKKRCSKESEMKVKTFNLVVPTIPTDVGVLIANIELYFQNLPINSLIVIGPEELSAILSSYNRVIFINESNLIDIKRVKNLISKRLEGKGIVGNRAGWYAQQFLKMAYSRVCKDEYYILWDSDTVPVKSIDFFDKDGKPYLDYKTEYFKEYFETMSRILPGYTKTYKGSFIAEHMLVNTKHMREMLDVIESNEKVKGDSFVEKIINSISLRDLEKSGFSEFETYGTSLLSR